MRCKCGNKAAKGRSKCHRCRKEEWRKAHPMENAYAKLRWSAQRRNISFKISFRYFAWFAKRTDYLNRTGCAGHCLTVDRKDNLKGYVVGNIQALTRVENSRKRIRLDELQWRGGGKWRPDEKYEPPAELVEALHQAIEEEGGRAF